MSSCYECKHFEVYSEEVDDGFLEELECCYCDKGRFYREYRNHADYYNDIECDDFERYDKSLYRKCGESVPIRKEDLSDYEMTEDDLIALAAWARGWGEE